MGTWITVKFQNLDIVFSNSENQEKEKYGGNFLGTMKNMVYQFVKYQLNPF